MAKELHDQHIDDYDGRLDAISWTTTVEGMKRAESAQHHAGQDGKPALPWFLCKQAA